MIGNPSIQMQVIIMYSCSGYSRSRLRHEGVSHLFAMLLDTLDC
jgi:hypothetical protein